MKIPDLSPQAVVSQLDAYVIGQSAAKRALAVALRNRWRRQHLSAKDRLEVRPRNIILVGSSGVGKTEIARRLADIAQSPFVKVDATTLTEVGYVGGNVTDMIEELVNEGAALYKKLMPKIKADEEIDRILLESLIKEAQTLDPKADLVKLKADFKAGKLEDVKIPLPNTGRGSAFDDLELPESLKQALLSLNKARHDKERNKLVTVAQARKGLKQEFKRKSPNEPTKAQVIQYVENHGIIFIDEIDKIAIKDNLGKGGGISRDGVQRDLLAIVEGTSVKTSMGYVKTDGILFIAAGAFQMSKIEDLTPELRGRFPIRATLESLKQEDFKRILTDSRTSIIRQYQLLLKTEGVDVTFTDEALDLVSAYAYQENQDKENLGARRLQSVLEQILEDLSFNVDAKQRKIVVDRAFIERELARVKI